MWETILSIFSITAISSVFARTAPIIFASIGETISERVGVINLSVEGTMMLGAMVGFAIAKTTNSLILGFGAAMLVGALMAAIVAFSSITLKRDQVAVGCRLVDRHHQRCPRHASEQRQNGRRHGTSSRTWSSSRLQ